MFCEINDHVFPITAVCIQMDDSVRCFSWNVLGYYKPSEWLLNDLHPNNIFNIFILIKHLACGVSLCALIGSILIILNNFSPITHYGFCVFTGLVIWSIKLSCMV